MTKKKPKDSWLKSKATSFTMVTAVIIGAGTATTVLSGAGQKIVDHPLALASKGFVQQVFDRPNSTQIDTQIELAEGKRESAEENLARWRSELLKARSLRQFGVEELASSRIRELTATKDKIEEQIRLLKTNAGKR